MNITKEQADKVIAALEGALNNAIGHNWQYDIDECNEAITIMRGLAEDAEPVPRGFEVRHNPPWSALTDAANDRTRYTVFRIEAPFCGKDDVRQWSGPTLQSAMEAAHKALKMPYTSPQAAQTDEREAFEAWCVSRHLQPQLTTDEWTKITEYQPFIQAMWEGWQARAGRKG